MAQFDLIDEQVARYIEQEERVEFLSQKYNLSRQQLFEVDMAVQWDSEPEDFGISYEDYFGHPRPEVVAGPVLAPPTFGG